MYFQSVLTQDMVLLVIRRLQVAMFGHLSDAALARVEREAPAALAARFTTDATVVREAMTRAVNAVADVATVFGLVVTMFAIDWKLSLIAAFLYPLAGVPVQRIGKRMRRASGGHAGAHGRGRRHAERELCPGPHGARLWAGAA